MNFEHSRMAADSICFMAEQTQRSWQETALEAQRPSVLFRPRIFLDGSSYCALYGENIMDGCAGFGDTPNQAMRDFDNNWYRPLSRPLEKDADK